MIRLNDHANYSHTVVNSTDKYFLTEYLFHEVPNVVLNIVDNDKSNFNSLIEGVDNSYPTNRAEIKIHESYYWNRGHKVSLTDIDWLISNIPAGEAIYLHDVTNLLGYTDKGNKRFINFMMKIVYDTTHHWIINIDSKDLNEKLNESMSKFCHNNKYSLEFLDNIRRDNRIEQQLDRYEKSFYVTAFKNTASLLSYAHENHPEILEKAYNQVIKLLSLSKNMTANEATFMFIEKISPYPLGQVTHLAKLLDVSAIYLMMAIAKSITKEVIDEKEFSYIQFSFANIKEFTSYSNNSRLISDYMNKFWQGEDIMTNTCYGTSISRFINDLKSNKINPNNPLTRHQFVSNYGFKYDDRELFLFALKYTFGLNGNIPVKYFNLIKDNWAKKYTWNELWDLFQNKLDKFNVVAESNIDRISAILDIEGILSIHRRYDYSKIA